MKVVKFSTYLIHTYIVLSQVMGNMSLSSYNKERSTYNLVIVEVVGSILSITDLTTIDVIDVSSSEANAQLLLNPRSLRQRLKLDLKWEPHLNAISAVNVVYRVQLVLGKYPVGNPSKSISEVVNSVSNLIVEAVSTGVFQDLVYISAVKNNAMGLTYADISVVPTLVSSTTYSGEQSNAGKSSTSLLAVGSGGFIAVITIGAFLALVAIVLAERYLQKEGHIKLTETLGASMEALVSAFDPAAEAEAEADNERAVETDNERAVEPEIQDNVMTILDSSPDDVDTSKVQVVASENLVDKISAQLEIFSFPK